MRAKIWPFVLTHTFLVALLIWESGILLILYHHIFPGIYSQIVSATGIIFCLTTLLGVPIVELGVKTRNTASLENIG